MASSGLSRRLRPCRSGKLRLCCQMAAGAARDVDDQVSGRRRETALAPPPNSKPAAGASRSTIGLASLLSSATCNRQPIHPLGHLFHAAPRSPPRRSRRPPTAHHSGPELRRTPRPSEQTCKNTSAQPPHGVGQLSRGPRLRPFLARAGARPFAARAGDRGRSRGLRPLQNCAGPIAHRSAPDRPAPTMLGGHSRWLFTRADRAARPFVVPSEIGARAPRQPSMRFPRMEYRGSSRVSRPESRVADMPGSPPYIGSNRRSRTGS